MRGQNTPDTGNILVKDSHLLGASYTPRCQQSKHLHSDELASISNEREPAVSRNISFYFEILSPSSAKASEKFIFPQSSTCGKHLKIKLMGFRNYAKLIARVHYSDPNYYLCYPYTVHCSIYEDNRLKILILLFI